MQSQTEPLAQAVPADIANAWQQTPGGNWIKIDPALPLAAQMYNCLFAHVTPAMAADAVAQSRTGAVKYNVRGYTQHHTARTNTGTSTGRGGKTSRQEEWMRQHFNDEYNANFGGATQRPSTFSDEDIVDFLNTWAHRKGGPK